MSLFPFPYFTGIPIIDEIQVGIIVITIIGFISSDIYTYCKNKDDYNDKLNYTRYYIKKIYGINK